MGQRWDDVTTNLTLVEDVASYRPASLRRPNSDLHILGLVRHGIAYLNGLWDRQAQHQDLQGQASVGIVL
jgi:hypothetical protein